MAKLTLTDLSNLQNDTTATSAINANNAATETAMENTLSRDGTSPNTMGAALDMNSNRIINLPSPISVDEPLRLSDANSLSGGGTITFNSIPTGGAVGQVLAKTTATDYDVEWIDVDREGTWTPVITFDTPGDLAVVYVLQSGKYLVIDNLVKVDWVLQTTTFTHTTSSGDFKITGLPYTVGTRSVGSTDWQGISKANYTHVIPLVNGAGSSILLQASGSGQNLATLGASDFPSGGNLKFNGTLLYTAQS